MYANRRNFDVKSSITYCDWITRNYTNSLHPHFVQYFNCTRVYQGEVPPVLPVNNKNHQNAISEVKLAYILPFV